MNLIEKREAHASSRVVKNNNMNLCTVPRKLMSTFTVRTSDNGMYFVDLFT